MPFIMNSNRIVKTLWVAFLAILMVSCIEEGDETISLEYGNPRKMIIGEWAVTKCQKKYNDGRVEDASDDHWVNKTLTFFDDGTYTDSSDSSKKYKWQLTSDSKDEPYYGGISLDGTSYEIISLGNGRWTIKRPGGGTSNYGWYWEFEKGASPENEENGGGSDNANGKIVRIDTNGSTTTTFEYDNQGRISKVYNDGCGVNYSYTTGKVKVQWDDGGNIAPCIGYLNSDGYLSKAIRVEGEHEYGEFTATYDDKYLISADTPNSNLYKLEYNSDGNLDNIKWPDKRGWKTVTKFQYTDEKNDANIDLTSYLAPAGQEHTLFAPYGFLGKRSKNLISKIIYSNTNSKVFTYERDKKGRISQIRKGFYEDNEVVNVFIYNIYYN